MRSAREAATASSATTAPTAPTASTAAVDAALALAAAVAWTWPLAPRAADVLRDRYDARTQAWVVAWVEHALRTSPGSLFQANAFAPARDVLAFSEPLIGYGVAGLPLALAGAGPVLVLNVLCILALAFSAFSVARLARELGAPRPAALLGAAAASFGALTTVQLGFVSFAAWGGIAWVVLYGRRALLGGGRRDVLALALVTAALGWTSLQLLAMALTALAVVSAARLASSPRETLARGVPRLAAGLAGALLLLVPLAIPMLRVRAREGFTRTEAEVRRYSATPAHWLATTSHNPGQAFVPFRSDSEKALYPGTAALALALAGLVLHRRAPRLPALAGAGALLVATGFLASLGPSGGLLPLLARLAPPLFGGLRVAARFGFVAQAGFGLLAASGAAKLLALADKRGARLAIGAALLAGIAADVRQAEPFDDRPAPPPPVERFLAAAEAGGPILHLPLTFEASEAEVVLDSTAHFKPVVNGTLSYVPARHAALAAAFREAPLPPDLEARVEAWPVGTIVVHDHRLPLERRGPLLSWLAEGLESGRLSGPLRFDHGGGTDWLFGVVAVRGAGGFGAPGGGDPGANAAAFRDEAAHARTVTGKEEPQLLCSIDDPAEGASVAGDLAVRGWAQETDGPLEVVDVLVDGERRPHGAVRRFPRPDVGAVLPRLGDVSAAGYSFTLARRPEDRGTATLTVRFLSRHGTWRTLRRAFAWAEPRGPRGRPPGNPSGGEAPS